METVKKCFNPKVLAFLAVIILVIAVFAPHMLAASSPLLLLAICPLSMIGMMFLMKKSQQSTKYSATPKRKKEAI